MSAITGMVTCGQHGQVVHDGCLSCGVAIDWNLYRKSCECGVPAIGYVIRSREDVGYHCATHYDEPAAAIAAAGTPDSAGTP